MEGLSELFLACELAIVVYNIDGTQSGPLIIKCAQFDGDRWLVLKPLSNNNNSMGTKLFVGSIAWATTDASLRAAFEQFGEVVDAKVITDRETGRSRGFGFVTMADEASAQSAIEGMNGQELDGRTIAVNVAMDPKDR